MLPTGWSTRVDTNGRMYYADHIGRTTTWNDPTLPSGWVMEFTDFTADRPYFIDHNTGTATWDDPRPPKSSDANVPSYDGRTTTSNK
jgi:E3 ubiquitin-protein ligase NEDD4